MPIVTSYSQIEINNLSSYGYFDHLGNVVTVAGCCWKAVVPQMVPAASCANRGAPYT